METRDADDFSTARIERAEPDDPLLEEAYEPGAEEDEDLGESEDDPNVIDESPTEDNE